MNSAPNPRPMIARLIFCGMGEVEAKVKGCVGREIAWCQPLGVWHIPLACKQAPALNRTDVAGGRLRHSATSQVWAVFAAAIGCGSTFENGCG
jgi:hypothetical protein